MCGASYPTDQLVFNANVSTVRYRYCTTDYHPGLFQHCAGLTEITLLVVLVMYMYWYITCT